jgi:hypothetical protein
MDDWRLGTDEQEGDCKVFLYTVSTLVWRKLGKPRKPESVQLSLWPKAVTQYLSNTRKKY